MGIEKKGLINFQNKIKKLVNSQTTIKNQVADQIANEGVSLAKQLILYKTFIIEKTDAKNGYSQVIAHDPSPRPHIAFVEFGTGFEGKASSYNGNLPSTWEYYTETEYKVPVGLWKAGKGAIVSGQVSQGNMWNVSLQIQSDLKDMIFNIKY